MFLFKKKPQILLSPADGVVMGLEEVADEVFSQGYLGKGIAIRPESGCIVSPCDGTVCTVAETGHAINLLSSEGAEVLLHVGIDTVKLAGRGFAVSVSEGQTVKAGDILINADLDTIRGAGYDTVVLTTVCNTEEYQTVEPAAVSGARIKAGEAALFCRK